MGQSKGGGYKKAPTTTNQQQTLLNQFLSQAGGNTQQASQAYQRFLTPEGQQSIMDQYQNRFQQQTIPSILNAFGSNAKSSSALNQALAAGAANLNSDIAADLSRLSLGAAQGLGNLGVSQGQLGAQPQFAFLQRQQPFWQSALLAGIGGGGQALGGYLGRPSL